MGTPFKMKGMSFGNSPMNSNGSKRDPKYDYKSIDFLKTDYAKGKGVGDLTTIKRMNESIDTYGDPKPEGKFMATKTKLKAKKKTKHIGNELRKKYGH